MDDLKASNEVNAGMREMRKSLHRRSRCCSSCRDDDDYGMRPGDGYPSDFNQTVRDDPQLLETSHPEAKMMCVGRSAIGGMDGVLSCTLSRRHLELSRLDMHT